MFDIRFVDLGIYFSRVRCSTEWIHHILSNLNTWRRVGSESVLNVRAMFSGNSASSVLESLVFKNLQNALVSMSNGRLEPEL